MKHLWWLIIILSLAGCSSSNLRRDMDITGSLPRAIGLGGFSPACIFLCFPSATFAQGDIVREEIDDTPLTIRTTEIRESTKGGGKSKPQQKSSITVKKK